MRNPCAVPVAECASHAYSRTMSVSEAPREITAATLYELWHEIALYLEIWDLIGEAA